ncbi:hypothetical protein CI105_08130 [Candidatus Izimaplasma bacterium ZiA1]|uniref:ABC transporter ATP-binding protein n=1 Tax=Candidatus Izimoplasma sp. ZiA1 TaxID=2024899 RepID=UPI000BAA58B9|nr:hypothetical protein CI105_08130 [Candidatus Izimaplasma bacterium ZiA1]
MQYSLFNNIIYVYKESFKKYPRIKWFLSLNFITELLVPFFTVVITTLLVYSLTHNVDVETYILVICGLILAAYILEAVRFWSFTRYNSENTFTRASTFWIKIAEHQLKTDYMNVEAKDRRTIISKAFAAISSNFYGIEMMLKQVPLLVINFVGMIIYACLIAVYVPLVLWILLAMSIVNFFLTKRANKYMLKKNDSMRDEFIEKYYLSKDSTNPNYGKDIRIYNIGKWFDELFVRLTKNRKNIIKGIEGKFLFANLSNTIFLFIRDIAGYLILLNLVVNGSIDLTTFTFLIGIVTGFSMWLNGFTLSLNELRGTNIRVNDFRKCLTHDNQYDKESEIKSSDLTKPITIEFKDVTFSYPGAETPTIKDLSFKIDAGEKVALVGSNGAGKTTIIKLIVGLYQPDSGSILVNGVDTSKYNIDDYMRLFSVVFQDSEPLSLTIENNISCSDTDIDSKKLQEAIFKAGLKEKIDSLENKEKSYITQTFDKSGIRLSGGENQKLMLARSLYKDAPILILDEPTAALDPIAEEEMYLKYKDLVKDSTSIFISHRLSSTKFCDRIIYLDSGKIVEEGTHQELIKLSKLYKSVYDTQAQYYKESV